MTGPCLCGDPYCSSCGNPSAAAYADWLDYLMDEVDKLKPDEEEAALIMTTIAEVIKKHREGK